MGKLIKFWSTINAFHFRFRDRLFANSIKINRSCYAGEAGVDAVLDGEVGDAGLIIDVSSCVLAVENELSIDLDAAFAFVRSIS